MATFKAVVRTKKEYNTVYIRISHKSCPDYIPTSMTVHKSGIRKGEIADHTILANCAIRIKQYVEKLNKIDIRKWEVGEIKKFLTSESEGLSFTGFAEEHIRKMKAAGRKKPAANYTSALNSLKRHMKKENIFFHEITAKTLGAWIESLSGTARAKNMYPVIIKKLFDDGCMEHNDYDRDIIRIKHQPFRAVKIPDADVPDKRSAEVEVLRRIAEAEPSLSREKLAQDVMRMVVCLAGINTVDLYELKKNAFTGGKLCYNRTKTKGKRRDKAYMEIQVVEKLLPLFAEYAGSERLFNFCERYADADIFSRAVNRGLKSLCAKAQVRMITVYWLRHTWATVAQNECGASTEMVGFCLNHTSAHKTTEGYIKKDWSPVDVLNRKVIDFIFPP
ncbi:MAG: site-specific integrase [Tannerella sp.]|jgi:integrase|nr:site-specific integrase [Tannerella sp.]